MQAAKRSNKVASQQFSRTPNTIFLETLQVFAGNSNSRLTPLPEK
jgi:hypothetical protein